MISDDKQAVRKGIFAMVKNLHELYEKKQYRTILEELRTQEIRAFENATAPFARKARSTLQRNQNGEMLIHHAAQAGNTKFIHELLCYGEANDVNAKVICKGRFCTPLHYAVKSGNIETVKYLIEKGANTTDLPGGMKDIIAFATKEEMISYLQSPEFEVLVYTNEQKPLQLDAQVPQSAKRGTILVVDQAGLKRARSTDSVASDLSRALTQSSGHSEDDQYIADRENIPPSQNAFAIMMNPKTRAKGVGFAPKAPAWRSSVLESRRAREAAIR